MKIGQISDLHYCPEYFDEVDRCTGFAIDRIIQECCEVAVISGDLFDHRVDLHDPCVYALMKRVKKLADHMPVMILQGTFSHDFPGSLNVFKTLGGKFPVHVADSIGQVALIENGNHDGFEWYQNAYEKNDIVIDIISNRAYEIKALFSTLPPINKGHIAAMEGDVAINAGEYVHDLCRGWSVINDQATAKGIPTIMVSHGTVNGSITEQGCPMHGNDHEFSTGTLFASKAAAIMLGHIHQTQVWTNQIAEHGEVQVIAYPGSPGRLHFGELTDKGFLIWNVHNGHSTTDFITTPAKELLQIEFTEAPDMEQLKVVAESAEGKHVRIRYVLNEEDRGSVSKNEIEALFADASEVRIEPSIKPITRTRAEGITKSNSISEKLKQWSEVTETNNDDMQEKLEELLTSSPDEILEDISALLEGVLESGAA